VERLTDDAATRNDPRIADEVAAINRAFDTATKALKAERKSLEHKATAPIQIASFDC